MQSVKEACFRLKDYRLHVKELWGLGLTVCSVMLRFCLYSVELSKKRKKGLVYCSFGVCGL